MAFIQFKQCLKDPKQFLKLIALILCVCTTVYQLSQCIRKLMYPSISTHYRFDVNETIWYPDVTICRNPPYKTSLFSKYNISSPDASLISSIFRTDFPFETTTIKDFLNDVTYNRFEIIPFYSFKNAAFDGSKDLKEVNITDIFLLNKGRCITLNPNEAVSRFSSASGYIFMLQYAGKVSQTLQVKIQNLLGKTPQTLTPEQNFDIYLHNHNEFPFGDEYEDLSFIDHLYLDPSQELHTSITVEIFNKQSTAQQPCISDSNYSQSKCQQICTHNMIAKRAQCTLPWLRDLEVPYIECNNSESYSLVIQQLTYKDLRKQCDCPYSCNITIYQSNVRSRKDLQPQPNGELSAIFIYFSSNLVKCVTEVISYDWNTFLSEIGGSLGFLLGLSVIGTIAVLEEIIKIIFLKNKTNEKRGSVVSSEPECTEQTDMREFYDYSYIKDYFESKKQENENKY